MPGRTVSRRKIVGLLGGGVALAPAIARAFSARSSSPTSPISELTSSDDVAGAADVAGLVSPLRPGSSIREFTVASIGPLREGAVTVALENAEGHAFHLEILARDPSPIAPRPPAQTDRFAVYVRNGGDGWAPTVEEQGLAAMALGSIIAANEGAADASGFLTHASRFAEHSPSLLKKASAHKPARRA